MKAREIRGLNDEGMENQIIELKNELIKENGQIATGTTPKNPGRIKQIKKNIARILTIRNEKKIEKV
jgi:large subunit ribosomal protein L29